MDGFQSFSAPAKVNLFLHITGQRTDGYHLLQTVFRLLDFDDTIHLKVRTDGVISRTQDIKGVSADQDLCVHAAKLIKQHSGTDLGVDIAVDKRIPMGGGLGGGSSDAATVLLALNKLWDLNLPRQTLIDLGLKLGADVPVFIFGQNAWAEGIGEQLQAVPLKPAWYIIMTPQVHVSTAEVFSAKELTRNTIPTTIAAFSRVGASNNLHNDLEPVVSQQYPAVAACLAWLSQFSKARMSGSGASVFAETENKALAEEILAKMPSEIAGVPVFRCLTRGLDKHPLYEYASE